MPSYLAPVEGLNEAAVAALRFVAELGVHQHPWRGTLEINRPRQLDKQ
jgi:hypothetical protein